MAAATITTEHDEIRRWTEERGGFPVRTKAEFNDDAASIRIDFPRFAADLRLERISWDEWFDVFERRELAFLRQEETEDGQISHFNTLISRASVERAEHGVRRTTRAAEAAR